MEGFYMFYYNTRWYDFRFNTSSVVKPYYGIIIGFFLLFFILGCGGRSVPLFPPRLDIGSLDIEEFETAGQPEGDTLRLVIAGLRNARHGLYIDLFATGENAHYRAQKLGGTIHGGGRHPRPEVSEIFEIRNCAGDRVKILNPNVELLDYNINSRPLWAFFATPMQVNTSTMAGPTIDRDVTAKGGWIDRRKKWDEDAEEIREVIQVISVRTAEQLEAGCYEVRILPKIKTITDIPIEFDPNWRQFNILKPRR